MKFRAKMVETLSMKNLAVIASTILKLTKTCVLRLNRRNFYFMVCEENSSPKRVLWWCIIKATQFFSEFNIDGATEENEIFIEFPSDMFATSLGTLKSGNTNARCVKLKLTNKQTPCLTIEIELVTEYGVTRNCVHDIPVKVVPTSCWNDYSEPPEREYNISVELCQFKKLKNVVERFKKLGPFVNISVTNDDLLSASIKSTSVTVTTVFQNSRVFTKLEPSNEQSVRVDVKRLYHLLTCEQLMPRRTTLHFFDNQIISFDLVCDNFNLQFYLSTVEE